MPAKKKPTGKKGKPKKDAAAVAEHQRKLQESEEMLMSRLKDVAERSQQYAARVEQLQTTAKKRGHDAMEHYHYLNETVKRQEKDNKAILESLKKLTNDSITDKATLKQQFEDTLKRVEAIFLQKEEQLLNKNKQLMKEVSDLSLYKKMRHDLAKELELTKQTIAKNEQRHRKQLDDLEKKFVAAKEALQREAAERIAHSRKVYKEEVGKELDYESKLVRKENREMNKELKFHEVRSNELMKNNEKLKQRIRELSMESSLTVQKDREYALRGVRQTKQIKELTEKNKQLERVITQTVREFDVDKEAMLQSHSRQVLELEQQLEQHQQLALFKEKELKTMRRHAKMILKQRNEVEQFFLEALEQVKDEIRGQRQLEYKQAVQEHREAISRLVGHSSSSSSSSSSSRRRHTNSNSRPQSSLCANNNKTSSSSSSSALPNIDGTSVPAAPVKPSNVVSLNQISAEDRERVLRILFAKINNTTAASNQHLPKHSFDIDMDDDSRLQTPLLMDNNNHNAAEMMMNDDTFLTNMDTQMGQILQDEEEEEQEKMEDHHNNNNNNLDDIRFAFA